MKTKIQPIRHNDIVPLTLVGVIFAIACEAFWAKLKA